MTIHSIANKSNWIFDALFSNHRLFRDGKGSEHLFNVLKAYSIYNPQVGYCQGMSFVCATLLFNMLSEEEAFWMMVALLNTFQENYHPSMQGILEGNDTFNMLLKLANPNIAKHMDNLQSISLIFISRWFLTMFTDFKNWQTVLRLWDVIFYEGKNSLLRIALAIMRCAEKRILQCSRFEEIGPFLVNVPKEFIQPKVLLPILYGIDMDDLMQKLETTKDTQVPDSPSQMDTEPSLLSNISQLWSQFNHVPESNRSIDRTRSGFGFSFSFLNKIRYFDSASPQKDRYQSLDNPEFTPDGKRLSKLSGQENPKRSKQFNTSIIPLRK